MSGYILLGLAAVFFAMVYFSYIRDEHDIELRKSNPEHCRYGAPLKQTFVWWWRSKIRRT